MTSTHPLALESLAEGSLKPLCTTTGPFVTAYLAAYRPGASELPTGTRLKASMRNAAAELGRRKYKGSIEDLLAPFEQLAADPAMLGGASGSVIFSAPGFFRHMRLHAPPPERLTVAAHPYITPALPNLAEQEFYILSISRKQLRLGRWREGECGEVTLPPGFPTSIDEAVPFDQPDHSLDGRSTGGGMTGQAGMVRFTTSADREKGDKYMHDYLRIVDRELTPLLRGALLVAAGTDEELAAFRRATEYPRVLEARSPAADRFSWVELAPIAYNTVLDGTRKEAEKVLEEARESTRRDRISTGPKPVLKAAAAGRVHKLLLASGAEFLAGIGRIDPQRSPRLEGPQDLLNAAAVETIAAGGEIHVLDAERLGALGPVSAILRY